MLKDKFTTNYSQIIRPEYQSLIQIVAIANGWVPPESEDPAEIKQSAQDFISGIGAALVKQQYQALISTSLNAYFGMSQAPLITQAMSAYDNSVTVTCSWEQIEEE